MVRHNSTLLESTAYDFDERVDIETIYTSWTGVIITALSAAASIAGSVLVICVILRSEKGLRRSVYHRILLGMSIADIVQSLAMGLTTLPMPKDMIYGSFQGVVLGNHATCIAQGFFNTFGGMTGIVYSASLSLYYLCSICFHRSDNDFAKCLEPYLHVASVLSAIIPASWLAGHSAFHPCPTSTAWCSPSNYPWWCRGEECYEYDIHDIHEKPFMMYFALLVSVLSMITVIVSMILIIMEVRSQEQKVKASASHPDHDDIDERVRNLPIARNHLRLLKEKKIVMKQALAYTVINLLGFSMLYVFPMIRLSNRSPVQPPALQVTFLILRPLQGLLNASVFMHHKVYDLQRQTPSRSCLSAFLLALKGKEGGDNVLADIFIVQRDAALSRLRLANDANESDDISQTYNDNEAANVGFNANGDGDADSSGGGDDNDANANANTNREDSVMTRTPDPSSAESINDLSGFSSLPSFLEMHEEG